MIRAVVSFPAVYALAALMLLSGCGEPEPPRFIPASGNEPTAGTSGRSVSEKASREVTIPKNIETH